MTNQEKFLNLYRDYEQLLRAEGADPKAVEDELAQSDAQSSDRLRLCRQFRNYMSHVQDPGFVEPTEKMMKFLSGRADALRAKGDAARKHLRKPEAAMLEETEKVSDAMAKFSKLKATSLPLRKKDGTFGRVSLFDLLDAKPSAKLSTVRHAALKPKYCSLLDPFQDLDPSKTWLCTSDGNPDGKLLGVVRFDA